MSIEKLRAKIASEIAPCDEDFKKARQKKVCEDCDMFEILRLLLDEHEASIGPDVEVTWRGWRKTEEAIRAYGEDK